MSKAREYLNSFNYFRGLAILFIVAGHVWWAANCLPTSIAGKTVFNIVQGGTALFVFISGFLFYHVFYPRLMSANYHYFDFMRGKIKNVLSPYLVLSIVPVLLFVFVFDFGPSRDYMFLPGTGLFTEYIRPILLYLLTGVTFTPYWFIPFIMVVFALTPVFMKFIQSPLWLRITIVIVLFCAAVIVHRPVNTITNGGLYVLHSLVYYIPVYLLGIMVSMHRDSIYRVLKGKDIYLLVMVLVLAVVQAVFYDQMGNFHKDSWTFTVIDVNLLQKVFLCFFLMVFFHRFEQRSIPVLSKIADSSFALYFIHPILLYLIQVVHDVSVSRDITFFIKVFDVVFQPYFLIIFFILTVAASYVIAVAVKSIFKSRSRQIIGW